VGLSVKVLLDGGTAWCRLARVHVQVADQRLDHLHKRGIRRIGENRTVVPEEPNVSGMLHNRKLSGAIADTGWRPFGTLLECEAEQQGRGVVAINCWPSTSRACSACGHRDGKQSLSVCAWWCSACGAEHHRDRTAVKTILAAGLAERLNACGAEGKTGSPALGSEAGTHLTQGVQPCTP